MGGRGDGVRGTHLCGLNTGTMGLCVIGNFTNVTPTQTAVDKLSEFLAWNACHREIDPLGISFHAASSGDLINISGHLDGCPTQCPGNMFYPMLPQIRSAVADHINNNCSSLAASILEAVALSDTEIELNWTDEVDGETGFEIERSKFISSLYQPIATVGANTTTYTDTDLMADTKYFYRIRAFNETDTSAYSNEVEVFTLVTSVENTLNASQVQLFPNPVKDQLFLEINHPENGKLHLEWHDLTGKAIRPALELEKTVEFQQFNLSAKDLPAGVYMLRLKLGAETGIFRIVKQ